MSRAASGAAGRRRLLLPMLAGLLVVAAACWRAPIAQPAAPSPQPPGPLGLAAQPARVAVGAASGSTCPAWTRRSRSVSTATRRDPPGADRRRSHRRGTGDAARVRRARADPEQHRVALWRARVPFTALRYFFG